MNDVPIELSFFLGGTGFLNGVFLSVYLYIRKGHISANKYLSLLLLAISIKIGYAFIYSITSNYIEIQFFYWKIAIASYLSIGPLALFYTIKSFNNKFKLRLNLLFHFLPALTVLFLSTRIIEHPVRFALCQTQFFIYLVAASFKLRFFFASKKIIINKRIEKNLKWARNLLIALILIWISVLTRYFIELATLYSFVIYVFIFLIFDKNKLFTHINPVTGNIPDFKNKLLSFIDEEKPYLDSELSLTSLAEKLGVNKNILSNVINDQLGKNFTDFINSYRIKEVKSRFQDPDSHRYTIASIAYDCGFNNLSTFNLAFKKELKMTPRQYQKNQKGNT